MYQEEVKSAIILLYLGILAGMDVRKRQISLVLTGVLFLAGIGWQILVEQTSWLEWLLSLLPGAGFLTLSYISREQVGYTHMANLFLSRTEYADTLLNEIREILDGDPEIDGGATTLSGGDLAVRIFGHRAQKLQQTAEKIKTVYEKLL